MRPFRMNRPEGLQDNRREMPGLSSYIAVGDNIEGSLVGVGWLVGALADEGVIDVGDGHQTRAQGDRFPL